MTCATCGRPVPEGKAKCVMCGATVGGKAPKVASVPEPELDFLPEKPASPASTAPFNPPADLASPSGTPGGPVIPTEPVPGMMPSRRSHSSRGAAANQSGGSGKKILIGGLLSIGVVVFLALKLCGGGPSNKIIGRPKFEATLSLYPNSPKLENIDVTGTANYSLQVKAIDGEILIGVVRRAPRDIATPAALKKLPDKLTPLAKGETRELTGEWGTGQYSWVLLNETKKPVKVEVKFSVK